jgi:hypothetical protein
MAQKQRAKKEMPVSPGRPKGVPNKVTTALKEAILNALDTVGGEQYLVKVANEDPKTFCTLIGKVLPMTVEGNMGVEATVTFKTVYE